MVNTCRCSRRHSHAPVHDRVATGGRQDQEHSAASPLCARWGLDGQTFEIEVVGLPSPRTPVFVRAYVTVTDLVTAEDQSALQTSSGPDQTG